MKNPTTIEEIINWPKEYRIINGEIGVCSEIDYKFGRIKLSFGEDEDDWFKLSDVQELAPLSFEGKRIAIGDWLQDDETLKWSHVCGYHYEHSEFVLETHENGDIENYWELREDELSGHKTNKHDPEVEKAIKLLTERGVIIDGKVIL